MEETEKLIGYDTFSGEDKSAKQSGYLNCDACLEDVGFGAFQYRFFLLLF